MTAVCAYNNPHTHIPIYYTIESKMMMIDDDNGMLWYAVVVRELHIYTYTTATTT